MKWQEQPNFANAFSQHNKLIFVIVLESILAIFSSSRQATSSKLSRHRTDNFMLRRLFFRGGLVLGTNKLNLLFLSLDFFGYAKVIYIALFTTNAQEQT